jgi:CheY-like chemotaxis protein
VLVVDDDELVRWSAAEGLKEYGYSVQVASDAPEALRCCLDAAVGLLDHDLPGADGLALAQSLRRHNPRCAIVLMTADPSPELHHRARERGIVEVLGKPFSLEELVDAIDDAFARSSGSPAPPRGSPAGTDGPQYDEPWQTEAPHR